MCGSTSSLHDWLWSISRSDQRVGTFLALVVINRIRWATVGAFSASATIVCPDMGVLSNLDPSDLVAITADIKVDVWEACRSILERAAVRDLGDPGVVAIVVAVPLLVESCIAHRFRSRLAWDARGDLVVNVKVLSATLLVLAANLAIVAVLGEHLGSIVVTLEVTISKEELAHFFAELMAIDHHGQICADNIRPSTIVVDLEADGVAVLVVCFASFIDASLATALGEKLLLCVIVEEDVNIALDFLGGRPIDLAVLLQALLLEDELLISDPAAGTALFVLHSAGCLFASFLLAHAQLELLLGRIARHVSLEETVIGSLAIAPQELPLLVTALVLHNHLLQPSTIS
jgi:hypothetical protein